MELQLPVYSDAGTRALTITIAPSVAGTVFDALDYLTGYPWGCTEQTMSSFLPDLIVAQAVDKLHLKSPIDRATLNDMVKAGLDRLYTTSTMTAAGAGGPTIRAGLHDGLRRKRNGSGQRRRLQNR